MSVAVASGIPTTRPRRARAADRFVVACSVLLLTLGMQLAGSALAGTVGGDLGYSYHQHRLGDRFEQMLSSRDRPDEVRVASSLPLAHLAIPSVGLSTFVLAGHSEVNLERGPNHLASSPLPGTPGNAGIIGHRSGWGSPFHHLDRLSLGDEITVTLNNGSRYVYRVTNQFVVQPDDFWVFESERDMAATLTLWTCHPRWGTSERLVTSAALDLSRSDALGPTQVYQLDDVLPRASGLSGAVLNDVSTLFRVLPCVATAGAAWLIARSTARRLGLGSVACSVAIPYVVTTMLTQWVLA